MRVDDDLGRRREGRIHQYLLPEYWEKDDKSKNLLLV
jgi:hypothetical protein